MEITDDIPVNSMIGRTIGVYRLEEEIGRGGMGAVYRAERSDGEFRQTVAVKLIKRGMDTDLILKRFRRERQILAALDHPNIAYFLGGGSTEDGSPYFVMEYIAGRPLYKFCDENRLSIKERLQIFRQVCLAVTAAHENKVIHRDLKPSNILVKDDRKPKLLDFGIAKVFDSDLMATEINPTSTAMRAMTPEYASPEQISGEQVTVASDIYSLGVILYELLTGHRPYKLRRIIAEEVARVIREEMPTNPSGCLTRDEGLVPVNGGKTATLNTVLSARNSSLESLRRALAGDLDRIVIKALRKKPSERYRTAAEFADDISNYLDGRAVKAEHFAATIQPSGRKTYDSLSLAIIPFASLGTTTSDTGDDFLGIGLADALISRLSGVQRLVIRPTSSVLPFSNADAFSAGRELGVEYVLSGTIRTAGNRIRLSVQLLSVAENSTMWAKAFDESLTDVLELEDSLSGQVAGALLPQLTAEERHRLEKRGTDHPEAYRAYLRGRYFANKFTGEDLQRSVEGYNEAISIDPNYSLPYIGLADFYIWSAIFGDIPSTEAFTKAQELVRKALQIDEEMGEAYAVLAFTVLLYDWNWDEAERLVERAIELSPSYAFAYECQANIFTAQGRFEEGVAAIKRAEELTPMSPRAMVMSSWTFYQSGMFEEAVAKAQQAVDLHPDFPQGLLHLGNALTAAGRPAEAVAALRQSAEIWGDAAMPRYMLCHARTAEGNLEAATTILNKMLAVAETRYVKPYYIAMCYVAVGDADKAFEWFHRALEERNEWLVWFGTEPQLKSLSADPRFVDILRKTGNSLAEGDTPHTSQSPQTGDRERSIAILPFHLIGAANATTGGDEYLSAGIADAVTMRLSNVRRFLVRPTSSVMSLRSKTADPFAAGRELGVEFVVDGIIRRIGNRIRVTAQLLNVEENSTRWSASFAENFTDVLQLEDSISEQVIKQLIPKLTGEEQAQVAKRGTNVAEAHDAYMRGRYFWNQLTPDSFPKAIEAFNRAAELDPDYALAHTGIADYYAWSCIYGLIPPTKGFPKVLESTSRALELDDKLPEAHAALGLYYSNLREWDKSEHSYRKALELNPNFALGHEWFSAILVGTGRFDEGVREIRLAEQLDPLSLRPKVLTAWTMYQTRYYQAALEKAEELIRLNPDFTQSNLQAANVLIELGETERALNLARKAAAAEPHSPLPVYILIHALVAAGLSDEAREITNKWTSISETAYVAPYFLAMCNLPLGNTDLAFEQLEIAINENNAWLLWLGTEPKFDHVRNDPRFQQILRKTGNPIQNQQG
jgi:serine/threonine protein kinase/Tfp pilus assembly protein PilF